MKICEFGGESTLPCSVDVWSLILAHVEIGDRLSVLLVCKRSLEVALNRVWQPWANGGRGMWLAAENGFFCYYARWAAVAGARWNPFDKNNFAWKQSEYFFTAVCKRGCTEIVRLLLADPRSDFFFESSVSGYGLGFAAESGHLVIVELLLRDSRANPGAFNNFAVRVAADCGHLEVIRALLQDPRVNPGDVDNAALNAASSFGHLEVVRLLLSDPRVDPGSQESFSLALAARYGHLEVVRLLLEDSRVDPGIANNGPLRKAAEYGHLEVVRLLQDPSGFCCTRK